MPDVDPEVLAALEAADPRLRKVYSAWQGHFAGEVSARRLMEYLVGRGQEWANVDRHTMRRWMLKAGKIALNHRSRAR